MEVKPSKISKKEIMIRVTCIIIAFILWLINYNNNNPVNTKDVVAVKVSIKNQEVLNDSDLALSDSAKTLTTDFQITSRDPNPDLSPNSYAAEIDLKDLKGKKLVAGENSIEYTVTKKPDDVTVATTESNRLVTLMLEEKHEVKKVVKPLKIGNPKPDYNLIGCTYNGEPSLTVTITGPKDSVDKIDMVGFPLDLTNQEKNIPLLSMPFSLYTADGTPYKGNDITISPEKVDVVAIIGKTKTVPIVISEKGTEPDDIAIDSKTTDPLLVQIAGTGDLFDNTTEIYTEPIDLAKVSASIDVKLVIPDGIYVIDNKIPRDNMTVKVNYVMSKIVSKNYKLQLQPIHLDPTLSAVLSTTEVSVILKGRESDFALSGENDVNASLDLINLNEGTHQVPVILNKPDSLSIQSPVTPSTVEVTLTEN
ncbi:MAG: CdaR family protein [Oscillospiraceae bacterium]|nr:CdaR family protein [Oscillospiraceae bacterium]